MEIRDVLRICSAILGVCFYGVAFIGEKELKKAYKELEKQEEFETVREETRVIIHKVSKLIMYGMALGTTFNLIAIWVRE